MLYNIDMINQQVQVKIILPPDIKKSAQSKAQKSGMPLEGYIKHLIIEDIKDSEYPVFELSERSEKALREAIKNRKQAIEVKGDIKTFLENL